MPEAVRSKLLLVCALAMLALVPAALAGNGGFAPVSGESEGVDAANDAYYVIAGFSFAILLAVFVPLVVFLVRFRSRGRARDEDGAQIRGNTNLELAWTVGPVLILVAIGSVIFWKLPSITVDARAGEQELVVKVEGRQFYWRYVYPNGAVAIDRLVAPEDRLVRLRLTAPDHDVIHSYWVPAVSGKWDAIPGVVNDLTFRVRTPGVYRGVCGEFCGVQHAAMLASVEVLPPAEFDRWLDEQAADQRGASTSLGRQQWEGVCAKCHGPEVATKIGPQIIGSPQLADARSMEKLVREGRGRMPAVGQGWTDQEIDALTAYLRDVIAKATPEEGS